MSTDPGVTDPGVLDPGLPDFGAPDVTVIVVDDQPRFLTVAGTVVERTPGFHLVGQASDGAGAIDLVRVARPDVVLMDIHMPVVDGIEATRRILTISPGTMVVLLSSYDRADLPTEVTESGAAAYLHKEELAPAALRRLWSERVQPESVQPERST